MPAPLSALLGGVRPARTRRQTLNASRVTADTSIELFAMAGELPPAEAQCAAAAVHARGFAACAEHDAAWRRRQAGACVTFDGSPATVQGFNFGQMHLHMALGPIAERPGVPIKGLTGHEPVSSPRRRNQPPPLPDSRPLPVHHAGMPGRHCLQQCGIPRHGAEAHHGRYALTETSQTAAAQALAGGISARPLLCPLLFCED